MLQNLTKPHRFQSIEPTRSRRHRRVDGLKTPRHRADAATETTSRRWRGGGEICFHTGRPGGFRTTVPPPRHDVRRRRGPVPALRRVVVVGPRVAGVTAQGARRAPPEAPLEGHRPRRRGRPGHEAALFLRRLPRSAARAASEWWIARRLACIVDVGVTAPKTIDSLLC